MKQTDEAAISSPETTTEAPAEQISRLKTEIGQALQPIREAVLAADLSTVKKLYRSLIRTFHEDKFQDEQVKAAMREINKAVNQIDKALKADVPDERQRADLLNRALTDIENQTSRQETTSGETAEEVTEADIESETAIIGRELEALGLECRAAYDALQQAGRKIWELQSLQASLDSLSPEFRSAHQAEIQKISETATELNAKLAALDSRFTQTQMQLSFFRYYSQEKTALTDAPRHMQELALQAETVKKSLAEVQGEFDRENRINETLLRQMDKHRAKYGELQAERFKVAQWQMHLDRLFFGMPPFNQAANENRRQRQAYDAQDAQLVSEMTQEATVLNNLEQQRQSNVQRLQALWQEKIRLESQKNQIYYQQAAAYESISQRQAAHTAARTNISQAVRARKQERAKATPEAES
jgi:hypothetical protein